MKSEKWNVFSTLKWHLFFKRLWRFQYKTCCSLSIRLFLSRNQGEWVGQGKRCKSPSPSSPLRMDQGHQYSGLIHSHLGGGKAKAKVYSKEFQNSYNRRVGLLFHLFKSGNSATCNLHLLCELCVKLKILSCNHRFRPGVLLLVNTHLHYLLVCTKGLKRCAKWPIGLKGFKRLQSWFHEPTHGTELLYF